jgi:hypothetical protein
VLAYIFWHWKRSDVSIDDYEARLRRFHDALNASPPSGFTTSWCASITRAPWANDGGDAWEDWYLIGSSADLDPLEQAAISASRQVPHDDAARAAAGGTGGLYRLRSGTALPSPAHARWFAKPDGWSYPRLYETLQPFTSNGAALWGRQMTLGPAREFCLHTSEAVELPADIVSHAVALRGVFPQRA